ncbi:MAG TPA: hypothetical protein VGG26_08040 [Terracidiphilus sp.]
MMKPQRRSPGTRPAWLLAVLFCLAAGGAAATAQKAPANPPAPVPAPPASSADSASGASHITPEQGKQLFALVDELMKFSSDETGLPIKSQVKRQLTTRTAIESYLEEKFDEDQGAKRLQRDEVVLKKFGLLDHDFELKPFLLALLKEQIEAYYDSKTKTVNLLDWVDADEQKPVLAHELTHALQDQHSDLDKWDDQTPDDVSTDGPGDQQHLAKDEMDTARDAVAEGQATAVMMDYMLKPLGKSLVKDPEVLDVLKEQMTSSENSPVMARAPLLLSESMLFPYREGLSFEQDVWMDQGQTAAFAGALDHPPSSSWEIINPREYEMKQIPAVPLLPDIHPLVDKLYRPYDIGQVGQLDLHILSQLFGGDSAARDLTPAWNGGLYWAGQLRSATKPAEQNSTQSLALLYLSVWKNDASAENFAKLYAKSLARKYSSVHRSEAQETSASANDGTEEMVYSTNEGPVLITTRGKLVFVAESFPLDLARKLTALILDAQGTGEMRMAQSTVDGAASLHRTAAFARGSSSAGWNAGVHAGGAEPGSALSSSRGMEPLSAGLVHFFENCGVMKVVVDAAIRRGPSGVSAVH